MRGPEPELETLCAVSVILDLANGLQHDKSLLTALFGCELAADLGLPEDDQRAAFFGGLLRHLGCTAYAARESRMSPDDIALRSGFIHADNARAIDVLATVSRTHDGGLLGKTLGLAWVAANVGRLRSEWTREACGAARVLAEQLGFGPAVVVAIDEAFERWDGRGGPRGLRGDAISPAGRVATVAHIAVVFWLEGGTELASDVLEVRAGRALDPALAERARQRLGTLALPDPDSSNERLRRAEQVLLAKPILASVDRVATTFGDFADLQIPTMLGHSRRVCSIAVEAAGQLGMSSEERRLLTLAAPVHDLGQVAVPTGLWLAPRAWNPSERERASNHSLLTERILAAAPALADVAKIAGAHHERLDGSGYHRALEGTALGRPARLLAVADVAMALGEARPHRPAHGRDSIRQLLVGLARDGLLDGQCVEAVLGALGETRVPSLGGPLASLTPRERDVLRGLALGRTNKQIGTELGISHRTIQHHTISIYAKLGVDSRAAAALLASRHGLV